MTLLRRLLDARSSTNVFVIAVFCVYVLMPLAVHALNPDRYLVQLAGFAAIACVGIYLGSQLPLFDGRFHQTAPRFVIRVQRFHLAVWSSFFIFLAVHFVTADAIPLVSVFRGADVYELSQQRGELLKARAGAEALLPYLNTLFVSALLPYSLARLYLDRSRYRHLLMLVFLGYSISFLHKALFINVLLPLLYVSLRSKGQTIRTFWIVIAGAVLLYSLTILAYGRRTQLDDAVRGEFFSASYAPSNVNELLLWRSLAVPMFTARDTFLVFDEQLDNEPLWGATSSFLSTIFSLPRVPMERVVYEHQWGWNDLGNANSVFLTEAFVNFGLLGIIAFSLFVGQSLRWLSRSEDDALRALWTIYCFSLFAGGLIGMLLSNGYLFVFFVALFVRFRTPNNRPMPGREYAPLGAVRPLRSVRVLRTSS